MGTDIHTIVEIRKNGKWEYIYDVPDTFTNRYYNLFSILNKNIRNSCGIDGFEPKGLPVDLSTKKCRFVSQGKELENAYKNKGDIFCCVEGNPPIFYSILDEKLHTEIDRETFEKIKRGQVEEGRYMFATESYKDKGRYFVQDASLVGGKFKKVLFAERFSTLKEFDSYYYNYKWVEAENDFGYYEIDFEDNCLYGHSFLNLAELKTKNVKIEGEENYQVDKRFIDKLLMEIGELPENFIIKNNNRKYIDLVWTPDSEIAYAYEAYGKGIKEMEDLKEKYGVVNDEDIRIVFAFDC